MRPWILMFVCLSIAAPAVAADKATVKVDGSSSVFPITEGVAEEFQAAQRGKVQVAVGISGTGGGFKKFCRGEIDVQNASRPIHSQEMADCKKAGVKFIELPVAFDAMAVVVNPKNTWVDSITVAELKTIWAPEAQGKITSWQQVNSKWPKQPLKLFGAGADSGTFDYFTEAIVGKAKSSRGDYTASEDDNTLVQGIANDVNAIGYLPLAYYEGNKSKLKLLLVDGGKDAPVQGPVAPSEKSVVDGSYFPLSRPLFIYVNADKAKQTAVKDFVEFYLGNVETLARQVHYVPLSQEVYGLCKQRFAKQELGTAFAGHSQVGMKVKDIFSKKLVM